MFRIGQKVIYGIQGVCSITAVDVKNINHRKVSYYVLEPEGQSGSVFYVPKENPVALAKIQPLLSKDEFTALLSQRHFQEEWIEDENIRKQLYRNAVSGTDRAEIFGLVAMLLRRKKYAGETGKKLHQCDENFLKDAQKVLCTEYAAICGISFDEAKEFIIQSCV